MLKFNKGAMFGLDARIALAIFGALSVISGAALYSAIQQSKITAYIANMSEINKAIEQYMLDTGSDLPTGSAHTYDAENLVVERISKEGWNGPYIGLGLPPTASYNNLVGLQTTASSTNVFVKRAPNSAWGDPDPVGGCDGSAPCFYWVETNCHPNAIIEAVDLQVDGTFDLTEGKIRSSACSTAGTAKMYFQGPLSLSQN